MKGDKVQPKFYGTRSDGVKLYRFAVPNEKDEETGEWVKPKFKILQDQTGEQYGSAIDIEGKGYTYTETDIPVESEPSPEPEPEPSSNLTVDDTLQMLNQMGVDISDQ